VQTCRFRRACQFSVDKLRFLPFDFVYFKNIKKAVIKSTNENYLIPGLSLTPRSGYPGLDNRAPELAIEVVSSESAARLEDKITCIGDPSLLPGFSTPVTAIFESA
jgi:hypothetical protein